MRGPVAPPRRAAALGLAVAVAVGAAACGEDRGEKAATAGSSTTGTTATTAAGPVVATLDVVLTEYRITPANPTVPKPGVVEIEVANRGSIGHALEVEGPGGEVETPTIAPGQTADLKVDLDKPGRYVWYCPVGDHRERGMKGTITVKG